MGLSQESGEQGDYSVARLRLCIELFDRLIPDLDAVGHVPRSRSDLRRRIRASCSRSVRSRLVDRLCRSFRSRESSPTARDSCSPRSSTRASWAPSSRTRSSVGSMGIPRSTPSESGTRASEPQRSTLAEAPVVIATHSSTSKQGSADRARCFTRSVSCSMSNGTLSSPGSGDSGAVTRKASPTIFQSIGSPWGLCGG
jgi:hypothetical protein